MPPLIHKYLYPHIIPGFWCASIHYFYQHTHNYMHAHHQVRHYFKMQMHKSRDFFFPCDPLNPAIMPTSASTGVASPYPRPSPALAETGCCTWGVFLRGDKEEDNFTHPEPPASPRRARSHSGGTKAKRLRPTRPVGTWGFA